VETMGGSLVADRHDGRIGIVYAQLLVFGVGVCG